MTPIDRRRFILGATATLLATRIPAVCAQGPELKSIQLVVPTPPGTQSDLIARWLAAPMAMQARLPVTVLNRPGAAGAIAADAVLGSSPDAGALLLGGLDHVAYSHLNSDRRALDPFVDFVPVAAVNRDTWLAVTGSGSGLSSLAELGDAGRTRGPLSYASNGEGSTAHLLGARLCRTIGTAGQHVAYKDSLLPDLIAGRTAFAVMPTAAALPHVRSRKLRALAALTRERLPALPEVRSVAELGHPGLVFYGGLFVFAPASLAPHAARINGWIVDAQRHAEVAAAYAAASIEPVTSNVEQTRSAVAERLRVVEAMRIETFGRGRAG